MSADEQRPQTIAALRAIADQLENDESVPVPNVRVHYLVNARPHEEQRALLPAIIGPLPVTRWTSDVDHAASGHDYFHLNGKSGADVTVSADAEAVATAAGTRTVTEWTPLPELTALLGDEPETLGGAA